ncbi:MAG: DNA topoisomerase (ATP-hydrolyzing) subunit A [Clostridia bacterium]|nr:DNA topoisomerase (ATP-hydrolyzing) subunit A [Clostridia bacterium]
MAKSKKKNSAIETELPPAPVTFQPITETIEKNYMPYVMSVIVSRAIPEIDGFKPSHRKLLYTMYKMGLLNGNRTKSTNVVGATMKLNPHGDAAIYETMVRLTRGNGALLHPFVDSKGNFGKQYSSDMAYAASRYTEVRLDPFCAEIFRGIDKNAVDLQDNYDATSKEPVLLPTSFPNILVSPNMGIAVGMASKICSFNLAEICDGTVALLKNPKITTEELLDIIKAPDFPGGGSIIYNKETLKNIYEVGEGPITLRARYRYDKNENCIEIIEIPYSTTIEIILKKITDMIKLGQLKEVVDARNEIDLQGFKLTLDLRRGTDPDKLMSKLFKKTPLQDNFSCNFNVLIDGAPRVMGIKEILTEWIKFRIDCVRRELTFDLDKKNDKLHVLLGLGQILLDIDKAIKIIRETEKETDVIANIMKGFKIDEIQAQYIAEIKLRHLNREYILNRISEIDSLQKEIAELRDIISSEAKLKRHIAQQLVTIKGKYGIPRKTQIIYEDLVDEYREEEHIENYNVKLVFTKEGYFKKITLQSIRGNDEQALKPGDEVWQIEDADNTPEMRFVPDAQKVYKRRASEFGTKKASELGDYVPLKFDKGEKALAMIPLKNYNENKNIVFIFENGKGVKIPVSSYETKATRKKLVNAYSESSPLVAAFCEDKPIDILLVNDSGKAILINSKLIPQKPTRTSSGSTLFQLKKGQKIVEATVNLSKYPNASKCKKIKVPATGSTL